MLTSETPYKGLEDHQVIFGVGSNKLSLPIPATCPQPFKELLQRMYRPTVHSLCLFRTCREVLLRNLGDKIVWSTEWFLKCNVINCHNFKKYWWITNYLTAGHTHLYTCYGYSGPMVRSHYKLKHVLMLPSVMSGINISMLILTNLFKTWRHRYWSLCCKFSNKCDSEDVFLKIGRVSKLWNLMVYF